MRKHSIVYDLVVERRRYNTHVLFGRRFVSLGGSVPPSYELSIVAFSMEDISRGSVVALHSLRALYTYHSTLHNSAIVVGQMEKGWRER